MNRFFLCLILVVPAVHAQLNQNCTVSVLNRTVQAKPDGSWILPNIPANFGRVRARATCVQNGQTRSGESAFFTLASNQSLDIPPIQLGPTTPIPTSLTIQSAAPQLTQSTRTTQLTVTGRYSDNTTRNLTGSAAGTTYTISNSRIATITPDGLVTAVASGTVVIQATNEGTQGILSLQVVLTGDSDGDGIPDDVEIREGLNPNDPTDALADLDNDGLNNRRELMEFGTNIRNRDTDGDGLTDGEEVLGINGFTSNPLVVDTDGDGVSDFLEATVARTNPRDASSVNYAAVTTGLTVTPNIFTLTVNTLNPNAYTQLSVIATLSNNTTLDLTSRARGTTYSSSDLNVCNFGATDGRVFAGQTGPCTITINAAGRTVTATGSVRTFQPAALSQIAIPGYANNVDVKGGYAYVAAGASGLHVVNVSNPANPIIVATRDTPGNANDVRVVGDFAYVADGSNGLVIINISNPLSPAITGTVSTGSEAVDVFISGNFAYLASGSNLVIANVTNPSAPILVSTTSVGGVARGVAVKDTLAVVVSDSTNTLKTYNVTNPSSPALLGTLTLAGSLKDVAINGTIAAVAAFTGGAHFVDISAPATPLLRGNLPGSAPNGFVPRDVEFGIGFAVFAEQLFPNAVPFVDYGNITSPSLRGIIDFAPLGDYAGTGIAVSGPYVYMTGENFIVGPENGTSGDTRLFIGQYLPIEDLAGVAPTVSINAIPGGNSRIQGERLTISAEASDDIAVAAVNFLFDGVVVFTDTSAPYEYSFTVPNNANRIVITADAVDLANNRGVSAPVNLNIGPDPLTTVTGRILDETGAPIAGAQVLVTGDFAGVSATDGQFTIPNVTTVGGNITASATATINNIEYRGSSAATVPVRAGQTPVGDIRLFSARWETNIGPCWSSADDTFISVPLPFAFPYYGANRTTAFVGTNGYITFNAGDSTFTENIPAFSSLPRIAAFFDDLYGRSQGCAHYNASLPDRFVVTYNNVQHFSFGGSNTIQIILFQDGRIQFGFRGITALTTGTITGITPGPNSPTQQINFSSETSVSVPAGTAAFEYFLSTNPFDLDGAFVIFTPAPGGGYSVRTILPAVGAPNVLVTGGPTVNPGAVGAIGHAVNESDRQEVIRLAIQPVLTIDSSNSAEVAAQQIANAEVEVKASTDVRYAGATNSDRRGAFAISNVPRGGINVTLRKNGQVVGRGSAVIPPFPTSQRAVTVLVVDPTAPAKQ